MVAHIPETGRLTQELPGARATATSLRSVEAVAAGVAPASTKPLALIQEQVASFGKESIRRLIGVRGL